MLLRKPATHVWSSTQWVQILRRLLGDLHRSTRYTYTKGWHVPALRCVLMEQLLTPQELAQLLRLSLQTIYNRRSLGGSLPPAVHIGRLVRYKPADVAAWLDSLSGQHAVAALKPAAPSSDELPRRRGRPTKAEQIRARRAIRHTRMNADGHATDIGNCDRRRPV